jgi:hypothetical protein
VRSLGRASTPPRVDGAAPSASTPFAVSERALVKLLVELAENDRAVLDGAAAHIDELMWSPVISRAHARVQAARQVPTLAPAAPAAAAAVPARRTT